MTVAQIESVPLDPERGSAFDWRDAMFVDFQNGAVFDLSEYQSRDLNEMLRKDGKARTLEAVLTLPLRQCRWSITPGPGDNGEAEWINDFVSRGANVDGMSTPFQLIIAQMTSAVVHRRAYFEKVFRYDSDGKVIYDKVAFRPASTCRMLRDPLRGAFRGFEQDPMNIALVMKAQGQPIKIEQNRALVYVHGQHRDPIAGVSDLEIAYWCYKTKQKLMFLWFSFLESTALPRTVVTSSDEGTAQKNARKIASMKNSAVLGIDGSSKVTTLDVAGRGGDQFKAALDYLDTMASNSVLAGFTDLAGAAKGGRGSMALSKDQTDFFLQARQGVGVEMSDTITNYLLADLVKYNFGPRAAVPKFEFGPLQEENQEPTLKLLGEIAIAPAVNLPGEFVHELAVQAAGFLDLDTDKIDKALTAAAEEAKAQAAAAGANAAAQQVAGVAGAVQKATSAVQGAQKVTAPVALPVAPPAPAPKPANTAPYA